MMLRTKLYLLLILWIGLVHSNYAQGDLELNEQSKCATVESEQSRLGDKYQLYFDRFEEYISQELNKEVVESNTVYRIPIVFHIIHDGEPIGSGYNISTDLINAQLEQLNNDFRKIMGTSGDGTGTDTQIEFCAALVDENGIPLAEPGIDRIDRNTKGWVSPPFGGCTFGLFFDDSYIENTIKPQSIWNPEKYFNAWIMDITCGILGYAQFPEAASLPGIGTGNGAAGTDGVVVLYTAVGSTTMPFPNEEPYNKGRTMTHEVGHWLGLRHIWGDGDCSADDFCADTPNAGGSNRGCPNVDSCPGDGPDQVQNYMDYSDDSCMDLFTQCQTDRMRIVMGETGVGSLRREILLSSDVCDELDGFSINITNSPATVSAGTDAIFNFEVDFLGSFAGTVTLSTTGLPPGTTAVFSTNPVSAEGTYTLTISNTDNLTPGTNDFTIEGTDGGSNTASAEGLLIIQSMGGETCFTVNSTDIPVSIPDNTTVNSTLTVAQSGTITDVDVFFEGTHGAVRDLIFQLQSPSGTVIQLVDLDDPCNRQDDFDLGFDDESTATINDINCPPTSGDTFQPEEALSLFDGEEAMGTWTLIVTDDRGNNTGQLNNWSLALCINSSSMTPDVLVISDDPISEGVYEACESITSTGRVAASTSVTFKAGEFISLQVGFTVENGSTFSAQIQECASVQQPKVVETRTAPIDSIPAKDKVKVYPNPFDGNTNIVLHLAEEAMLSLQVFDLNGKQVATIVNASTRAAGTHQFNFDGYHLEKGVYVLLVQIGQQVQTVKLSVL